MAQIKNNRKRFQVFVMSCDDHLGREVLVIDRNGRGQEYHLYPETLGTDDYPLTHGGKRYVAAYEAAVKHLKNVDERRKDKT